MIFSTGLFPLIHTEWLIHNFINICVTHVCNMTVHGLWSSKVTRAIGATKSLSQVFSWISAMIFQFLYYFLKKVSRDLGLHCRLKSLLAWIEGDMRYQDCNLACRHMLGEDLSLLKVPDLLQLEQQLDLGASRVRARKASIWVFS